MAVLVTGGLFFELPLPVAVIGHEGGTVLVVLNGLRLLGAPMGRGRTGSARKGGASVLAKVRQSVRKQAYRRKVPRRAG
jgi:hypothetical protein